MKIRRGKLKDAKEILKFLRSTPELQGGANEQAYTLDFVKGSIKNKDRELVLIAEENKRLIGFLIAELWRHKGYSFFVDLFVKPELRNRGFASALYSEYEKILRKLHIKVITALVLVTNKRMQKWCKKHKLVKGNKMYFYEKENKMKLKINKILKNSKAMFLAYDHGLEHGPSEFNDKDVDPNYIIDIAKKGKYNAIILQKGIAEKYNDKIRKSKVPLILKLNGKTNLFKGEPVSRQLCTVKEALKLGAVAVGYTIYIGSKYESVMMKEFDSIEEDAHRLGMPVIAWIYPRGKSVDKKPEGELMAYAARTGLEIGADIIKMKYNGNVKDLLWSVKVAGKTKIVIAGGIKADEKNFLKQVKEIADSGAAGIAVGRNVWQSKNPIELSNKIRKIIFG